MKALDASELQVLTGYKQPAAQLRWVRENLQLEPLVGADGRPRLTWFIIEQAALRRRVGGTAPELPPAAGVSSGPTPNWRKAA